MIEYQKNIQTLPYPQIFFVPKGDSRGCGGAQPRGHDPAGLDTFGRKQDLNLIVFLM